MSAIHSENYNIDDTFKQIYLEFQESMRDLETSRLNKEDKNKLKDLKKIVNSNKQKLLPFKKINGTLDTDTEPDDDKYYSISNSLGGGLSRVVSIRII